MTGATASVSTVTVYVPGTTSGIRNVPSALRPITVAVPVPVGTRVMLPPVTGAPLYITLPETVALLLSPQPTRAANVQPIAMDARERIPQVARAVFMIAPL